MWLCLLQAEVVLSRGEGVRLSVGGWVGGWRAAAQHPRWLICSAHWVLHAAGMARRFSIAFALSCQPVVYGMCG
jgi:hypothetical protein